MVTFLFVTHNKTGYAFVLLVVVEGNGFVKIVQ
jgi:hypothetical protein